jgi:hypothetical protein
VREAKKPERLRLTETMRLSIPGGVPSGIDQPRLLGVQLKAELRKPLAQVSPEPLGILTMLNP